MTRNDKTRRHAAPSHFPSYILPSEVTKALTAQSLRNMQTGVGTQRRFTISAEVHVISSPDLRANLGAQFRMIMDDNLIDIAFEQQLLTKFAQGAAGAVR